MRKKSIYQYVRRAANLPAIIAHHAIGKGHTQKHRKTIGIVLMVIGTKISHVLAGSNLAFIFEAIGALIHASGAVPFIEERE